MLGWVASTLALIGLGLVVWAIVMARRHRHPRCARCGYDLHGRVAGRDSAHDRCPECGADLRIVASIVTGRWQLCTGVWLTVVAAAIVIVIAVSHVERRQRNVWLYVPATVLIWTARMEGTAVGATALREVERRLTRDTMPRRGVQQVLRLVLPRDEDDAAWKYRPKWRTAAYWAIARGRVPVADVVEYRRRLFVCELELDLSAVAQPGGYVQYTVTSAQPFRVVSARFGERDASMADGSTASAAAFRKAVGRIEIPFGTPPGEHELTLTVRCETSIRLAGRGRGNPPYSVPATWPAELRGTFVVEE